MSYTQKDNSGTLFKNDRRKLDTHPHMTGKCVIDGVAYWISAWTKENEKGRFQSLAFRRMDEQDQGDPPAPPARQRAKPREDRPLRDMTDDDIPY